jgi:hypothetical protein
MNVNQLMAKLRAEQKAGHGKCEVHMLAHDNIMGETQGEVQSVIHFEKDDNEEDGYAGRDDSMYASIPREVVYLHA